MKVIQLSDYFYEKYGGCTEIMKKSKRPYLFLSVVIDGSEFAIPFRHHINHPFAFYTVPPAGLDFTKSVVIEDEAYISPAFSRVDDKEWDLVKASEDAIIHSFKIYLRKYRHAKKKPDTKINQRILKYSALQYFDFL